MISVYINESSDLSIDPTSMRETTRQSWSGPIKPLPLLPTKYKFLSTSLPNSPRIGGGGGGSSKTTADTRNQSPGNASAARSPLCDIRLQRSKSGGEHRSSVPYSGFDPWATVSSATGNVERRSSPKHGDHGQDGRTMAKAVKKSNDMDFKCGALCLFLPGFGKGKPVRARRVEPEGTITTVISQRISLEKFECGSWRSSAIQCDDHENSSTLYFDFPLELIRTSESDTALPMNSGFLFNKGSGCVKGVLKTRGGSVERKSQEGRHVRFSTSSSSTQPASPSSCITPRLRKAREDFNAFLEAQSA